MITIKLSPVRSDEAPLVAEWVDPVLTVNGEAFDLSELDDGDEAQHDVLLDVSREVNDYTVTLKIPHPANAPYAMRFPEDIVMLSNGQVPVPEATQEVI